MCWFWVYLSAFSLNKSFWKSLRQLYIYIWFNSRTILLPGPHCEASFITESVLVRNARKCQKTFRKSGTTFYTNMSGIKSNLHTWIQNKTLYISQHILFCGETNNSLLPFWIREPDPFVLTNWFHWVLILPEHVCEYVKKKGIQSFFDTKTSSHWIVRSLKPCLIRRKLAPGRSWHKSGVSKWKCLKCKKIWHFWKLTLHMVCSHVLCT